MYERVERVEIVESTLREGEQFAGVNLTPEHKQRIALALDRLGVPYIEVTSPAASPRAFADAQMILGLGLRARVLAHVRCVPSDIQQALDAGVQGINLYFGTSPLLRAHGHRRDVDAIIAGATECIAMVRAAGRPVRFGCEDAFRTPEADLLRVCTALDLAGVERLSLADTVGVATPRRVDELVGLVRRNVRPHVEIEFHGHDDSACAVANAMVAVEAGARLVDTSVLGLGERNGITGLGALLARLYATDPAYVAGYDLRMVPELDRMVAEIVGVPVPFNTVVSGAHAFAHAAGAHTAAVLRDPRSYEVLDPAVFGLTRTLHIGHHLTGRHAVASRATALGLDLDAAALERATAAIKQAAAARPLDDAELDTILFGLATNRQTAAAPEPSTALAWQQTDTAVSGRELATVRLDRDRPRPAGPGSAAADRGPVRRAELVGGQSAGVTWQTVPAAIEPATARLDRDRPQPVGGQSACVAWQTTPTAVG